MMITEYVVPSFKFGGAPSKGFGTVKNVSKLIFWEQDWPRKVCRFSILLLVFTWRH